MAPQAPSKRRRRRPPRPSLPVWNGRNALTITVRYRGGAEAWYELRARGHVWRAPGSLALHDVMTSIYEGDRPSE